MSVTDRILIAIGVLAMVLLLSGAAAAAWLAHAYGTFELDARSGGRGGADFSVRLPGALLRFAAEFLPAEVRREAGPDLEAWLPAAEAALSGLRGCSDAQLVHVRSRGETVRITKEGDALLAEILSPRGNVRVKIPLGVAAAVVEQFQETTAEAAGSPGGR